MTALMTLAEFNALPPDAARDALLKCCGSRRWADTMVAARPFPSMDALHAAAIEKWNALGTEDFLEAFSHHPRIGDIASLRAKFTATAAWAGEEQKGAATASEATLAGLARGNKEYEAKFGHVFLVCATGKSADEMLRILHSRLGNDAPTEMAVAASEQAKITRLRLDKLFATSGG
jgi:2-oxo-4-hydroxy-4-carboxy-5-ureidoimidazoline decarboxylase